MNIAFRIVGSKTGFCSVSLSKYLSWSVVLLGRKNFIPCSSYHRTMSTKMNICLDKKNPSLVLSLVLEQLKCHNIKIAVTQGEKTHLKTGNNEMIDGALAVIRFLARSYPKVGLYGISHLDRSQIDSWIDFSNIHFRNAIDIDVALKELTKCLAPATFLVGYTTTLADLAVWCALKDNPRFTNLLNSGKASAHVKRWFEYCSSQKPFSLLPSTLKDNTVSGKSASASKEMKNEGKKGKKALKSTMEEGGKFFDLSGAEKGKVVVRFPPEASGYLHIGHAKAALMNQYYRDFYDGQLIFRFDDTNPAKENAHFEQIILDDIKLLQLSPDRFTRTSDYFDLMFTYAEQLIKQGDAYCDNSTAEEMKKQREERQPSPLRDSSVDANLCLFREMKEGTPLGFKHALRAKIDHKSDNGCLRDPVLYRCRNEEHIIHRNKYLAYPTYDFACPIVDSVEGVTHALRTSEYLDRDAQFYWILEKLGLRKPYIYSYSRLNLVKTVLSKRKLTYLVDEGYVDGWDDPRFPTVRGVLRRGMTVDGLKEFIIAQGSSKSNVHMEWDKIWSFNKKVIDPIAPRFNALLKNKVVPVNVRSVVEGSAFYPKHPKNSDVGEKEVFYSSKVFIEGEDANIMKEGELVTFINWGNLRICNITKNGDVVSSVEAVPELENKDFKGTTKVTWLALHSNAPFTPTKCLFFDNIITKADLSSEDDFKDHINTNTKTEQDMMGDPCLTSLKKGDIVQLQRRGYFICDQAYEPPSRHSGSEAHCILLHIPDGSTAGMMNQGKDKNQKSGSSKEKGTTEKRHKQSSPKKESIATTQIQQSPVHDVLYNDIVVQGDKIRTLKSSKASKDLITAQVTILKSLKAQYKEATGVEYTPPTETCKEKQVSPKKKKDKAPTTPIISLSPEAEEIKRQIVQQGDKVRQLKSAKASADQVKPEIDMLLKLKASFKEITGTEYKPPGANAVRGEDKKKAKSK